MTIGTLSSENSATDTWTSGLAGVGRRLPSITVIVISGTLAVTGTSSAEPLKVWGDPYILEPWVTSAGAAGSLGAQWADDAWSRSDEPSAESSETTRESVCELRRTSGLTWDQVGLLFGVSRRSVHFWASGKPLNAANEEHLLRVLNVVRSGQRGNARATRAALFEVHDGKTAFEMLVGQRYQDAAQLLGDRQVVRTSRPQALGIEEKLARMPLRPENLVDAEHESVHSELLGARAARSLRNNARGTV